MISGILYFLFRAILNIHAKPEQKRVDSKSNSVYNYCINSITQLNYIDCNYCKRQITAKR